MMWELVMIYWLAGHPVTRTVVYEDIKSCADAAVEWDKNFPEADNIGSHEAQCLPLIKKEEGNNG